MAPALEVVPSERDAAQRGAELIAAAGYEYSLPDRFDLIHLGMGPDGHTASLVPGDPILEVSDRQIAITSGEYQGTRRMSLTYKAIDRARQVFFLVTGEGKEAALSKLIQGDRSIPAGRVENPNLSLVTDIDLSKTADAP